MVIFKRKKDKPQMKTTKKKWIEYRLAKRVLVGAFSVFVLLFVSAFVRMTLVSQSVVSLQEQIKQLGEKNSLTDEQGEHALDERALHFFLSDFLDFYLPFPKGSEALKAREEALKPFYAKGVTHHALPVSVTREKKNYSLVGIQKKDNHYIALYWVYYTVSEPVEKEVKRQDKTEKTVEYVQTDVSNYLSIPFVTQEGKFVVVSEPYASARPQYHLENYNVSALTRSESERVSDVETVTGINMFLTQFFKKFVTGDIEELKYMMSEPWGLDGRLTFDTIEKIDVYKGGADDRLDVLVKPIFKDKGTSWTQRSKMKMIVRQKDGKYMVESLDYVN